MNNFLKTLKKFIIFSEIQTEEGFTLKENADKDSAKSKEGKKGADDNIEESELPVKTLEEIKVSSRLSENLKYIKMIYNIPVSGDVVIREFDIIVKDKVIKAFIVFIDGLTDRMVINTHILQPLMLLSSLDIKSEKEDIAQYVKSHLLPQGQLQEVTKIYKVVDEVNFGGCGLFIDGIDIAFTADVKGWEHRSVERPNTELVIRGPQEGFTELLRTNTAMIRRILKDEDLIVETVEIGRKNKVPCSLLYIRDIANKSLVDEVRRRLKSIKTDYLLDTGELEQFIEDKTLLSSPQMIATERPDRTASHLSEGKVAVIMQGSPFSLIMPATAIDLLHTPEDSYIRFPYANFLRAVRYLGVLMSLLLPGLYIAITNFHQEMIPTDLLLAIEASREKVPFPSVVEIFIMEIAFELIREAGIRIPGPIGPTLGIIGALILGQAAVAANIVSPILIIIVAVTGIGSFAIPNFSLGFAFRLQRFLYIILGATAGFLGITTGLFIQGLLLCSTKSFGIPFMVPFGPKTAGAFKDDLTRGPIWKQEKRPDYLNTKSDEKQPKVSRGWVEKKQDGEDGDRI